jgi:hypothetical protein
LPELIRSCAKGGVIVLTVKTTVWDAGLGAAIDGLAAYGRLRVSDRTAPYQSMPNEAGTISAFCIALTVN